VFAGPAIAGWIILSYGISWAFLVNALGYLILIISMLFLKTPEDFIKPAPTCSKTLLKAWLISNAIRV
jgi:hypothetical protein